MIDGQFNSSLIFLIYYLFCSRSWTSRQQSEVSVHLLQPSLVKAIFSPTVDPSDFEPHWVYGTWIPDETVKIMPYVAKFQFTKTHRAAELTCINIRLTFGILTSL